MWQKCAALSTCMSGLDMFGQTVVCKFDLRMVWYIRDGIICCRARILLQ